MGLERKRGEEKEMKREGEREERREKRREDRIPPGNREKRNPCPSTQATRGTNITAVYWGRCSVPVESHILSLTVFGIFRAWCNKKQTQVLSVLSLFLNPP